MIYFKEGIVKLKDGEVYTAYCIFSIKNSNITYDLSADVYIYIKTNSHFYDGNFSGLDN